MTTVLVAGAGLLGSPVAHALTDQDGVDVRLLVRDGWQSTPSKRDRIEPLLARGVTLAIGDVLDPQTLDAAVAGVDVVVSALQGGTDVIVKGQVALAEAAAAAGVRRFIPSDFAIDLFNAPAGAPQFEARKEAAAAIEALDLEVIHILQGAFMDQMLNPALHHVFVDTEAGEIRYYGTGDEPVDMTTVEDTARFTARIATDPAAAPGVHTISGARTTFKAIGAEVQRITGTVLRPVSMGDAASLRAAIAAKPNPWDAVMDWYALAMLTTPPFENPENNRYADARPTGLGDYLQTAYAPNARP